MQKYDLTVVIDGKATPAKIKSIKGEVDRLLGASGAKVGTVEDWGEKPLSYKVGKSLTGNFMFFPLELEPESAKALATKLNQEDNILRHLLVRKDS